MLWLVLSYTRAHSQTEHHLLSSFEQLIRQCERQSGKPLLKNKIFIINSCPAAEPAGSFRKAGQPRKHVGWSIFKRTYGDDISVAGRRQTSHWVNVQSVNTALNAICLEYILDVTDQSRWVRCTVVTDSRQHTLNILHPSGCRQNPRTKCSKFLDSHPLPSL